jgi:shikimate dehydrogenase
MAAVTGKSPFTLCGSLSLHPVRLGTAMHRAGYAALGMQDWTYVPFAVTESGLAGAIAGMRALGIRGFGVSMPFKIQILPLLDRLDPLAARIGAANTVVNDDGVLVGHNTDAWGSARALEEAAALAGQLTGKRVLVIGAGGAARAVAAQLAHEGMRVHVVNRSVERAETLARELGGMTAGPLADAERPEGWDVIVNASSAGMAGYGSASPVPERALLPGMVVMDIVYEPIETELLRAARRRGAHGIHGGRMLLHQARRQFELYTGRTAPLEAMDRALRESIGD